MNGSWRPIGGIGRAGLMVLLALLPAVSATRSEDERAVRAAYVFNVSRFVEWPSEKRELMICFIGTRGTGEFLQWMLDGKMSESRPINVKLFPSEDELPQCSILYIAESEEKNIHNTLLKMEGKSILTIGEADSFARDGGMVGLVEAGDQIHMQVNPEAAQRAGIKIGQRLLNLALIVRPGTPNPSERKVVHREIRAIPR